MTKGVNSILRFIDNKSNPSMKDVYLSLLNAERLFESSKKLDEDVRTGVSLLIISLEEVAKGYWSFFYLGLSSKLVSGDNENLNKDLLNNIGKLGLPESLSGSFVNFLNRIKNSFSKGIKDHQKNLFLFVRYWS